MMRPLPSSTLFPYTTLFRSDFVSFDERPVSATFVTVREQVVQFRRPTRLPEMLARLEIDRKSTRLNSSHGYISYAVFCLKKKNENRHLNRCQSKHRIARHRS